jgi:hypothetical protein
MAHTIYRNFMKLEDAESARNALLASGFPSPAVKFTPHQRVDCGGAVAAAVGAGEQVVATAATPRKARSVPSCRSRWRRRRSNAAAPARV